MYYKYKKNNEKASAEDIEEKINRDVDEVINNKVIILLNYNVKKYW